MQVRWETVEQGGGVGERENGPCGVVGYGLVYRLPWLPGPAYQ